MKVCYCESTIVDIKLPDTVNIYIEEIDMAYAITTRDGTYWLMTAAGKVVEQIDGATASNYTKIEGVQLDNPTPGQQAQALELIQQDPEATSAEPTEEPVQAGLRMSG